MPTRALVLDANILIRAVLGTRVRSLIEEFSTHVSFFVPDIAYREAEANLPGLVSRRGGDPPKTLALLNTIATAMEIVGPEVYRFYEADARERLIRRDPNDWPILATALALGHPIWTEDTDFFGCGVATWTSDRVRIFLRNTAPTLLE